MGLSDYGRGKLGVGPAHLESSGNAQNYVGKAIAAGSHG